MVKKKSKVINRYNLVIWAVFLWGLAIIASALKIYIVDGAMWRQFAEQRMHLPDVVIPPERGNIFSYDGQLMASSLPEYKIYLDMRAEGLKMDVATKAKIRVLAKKLSQKLGDRSANQYYHYIVSNFGKTRSLLLTRKNISYLDFKEIMTFPFLRIGWNTTYQRRMNRIKPFGSLAHRTVGKIYGDEEKGGSCGLELKYDSLLRGKPGLAAKERIKGRWEKVTIKQAENGVDVYSTIDVKLQDMAEGALRKKLHEIDAKSGLVVLMEVKTGKVRAITNLDRCSDGVYREVRNRAVSDMGEPGSTFKVASMMVALDDGLVHPKDSIDTLKGSYKFASRAVMKDHNIRHGGYGMITAEKSIWYSSNVGISRLIYNHYKDKQEQFVQGLYDIGLAEHLNLEIPGSGIPQIRTPKNKMWNKHTTMPWMSIGYVTQIPAIYTLTFFNAIANDGKMIKPLFVEKIVRNGETIQEFETTVVKDKICKNKTLRQIKEMMRCVIDSGTAHCVKSDVVSIAGKTGTAQIAIGGSYKNNGRKHQLTFCGFFPIEDPKYTCICQIRAPNIGYPSGGMMAGTVVKEIAEKTYAKKLLITPSEELRDTSERFLPKIKGGNFVDLQRVLSELDIAYDYQSKSDARWVKSKKDKDKIILQRYEPIQGLVPNVYGMVAKDAVYICEKAGLRVRISGKGAVYRQSLRSGRRCKKGQLIHLTLK